MARRRRRVSYARENQLVEIDTSDLLIGGAFLAILVGIGYLAFSSSIVGCVYTGSLNSGYNWAPQGNVVGPTAGSFVTGIAQDQYGDLYPVTGQVNAFDGVNVTFTPIQLPGQVVSPALASATPVQVPLAYVTPVPYPAV
jgi:hypothetical protein